MLVGGLNGGCQVGAITKISFVPLTFHMGEIEVTIRRRVGIGLRRAVQSIGHITAAEKLRSFLPSQFFFLATLFLLSVT